MSQQGIQAISRRAEVEPRFRRLLRERPLHALEGYDLTLVEHTTLETLARNGWILPGEPLPNGDDRERRGCGCLGALWAALRKLLSD